VGTCGSSADLWFPSRANASLRQRVESRTGAVAVVSRWHAYALLSQSAPQSGLTWLCFLFPLIEPDRTASGWLRTRSEASSRVVLSKGKTLTSPAIFAMRASARGDMMARNAMLAEVYHGFASRNQKFNENRRPGAD
jgi:hypothetical protein